MSVKLQTFVYLVAFVKDYDSPEEMSSDFHNGSFGRNGKKGESWVFQLPESCGTTIYPLETIASFMGRGMAATHGWSITNDIHELLLVFNDA